VYIRKNINYIVPSHKKEPKYLKWVRNKGETSQVQGVRGNYIIGMYRVYICASAHGNTAARLRMVREQNSGIVEVGSAGSRTWKVRKMGCPLTSAPFQNPPPDHPNWPWLSPTTSI